MDIIIESTPIDVVIDSQHVDVVIESRPVTVEISNARGLPGADGGAIAQPLRYKAILSQSGTSNPVAIVLENTISNDLEWEYMSLNFYRLKSLSFPTGLFTLGKTFFYAGISFEAHTFTLKHSSSIGTPNASNIGLICTNVSPITGFTYLSILIEIYP